MKNKIKLVAVDLDGTLLNNKKQIAPEQKKALQDAVNAGIKIVLCTGRPLFGVLPLYKELEMDNEEEYMILNNGTSIYKTKNFELIDSVGLNNEEITTLYNLSKGFDVDFTLTGGSHFFFVGEKGEEPNEKTVYDSTLVYTPLTNITLEEALESKEIMFKSMYTGLPEDVDKIEKSLSDEIKKKFNFVRSQDYILEALPLNSNKGEGIRRLIEKLNISKDEVMAIGDAANDVEMLTFVGHSVAMGNSSDEIKKLAKYVTDTNENNGVAKAIYEYVLK